MDMANRVQILGEAVYISQSANTPGTGMNPANLPKVMNKIVGQNGLFNFDIATNLREGNLWIRNLLNSP